MKKSKNRILTTVCCALLFFSGKALQSETNSLRKLMTKKEYEAAGLDKLTAEERTNLGNGARRFAGEEVKVHEEKQKAREDARIAAAEKEKRKTREKEREKSFGLEQVARRFEKRGRKRPPSKSRAGFSAILPVGRARRFSSSRTGRFGNSGNITLTTPIWLIRRSSSLKNPSATG